MNGGEECEGRKGVGIVGWVNGLMGVRSSR
jgi:hypothetical protein